jgi:hypothetical protein
MATIQYTTFRFNKPVLLSDVDFETLKEILNESPEYNINPPSNIYETFKGELILLGVGVIGLLISSLDIAEWLNWVGGIPAFIAFLSLLSFIPSLFSYLSFLSVKFNYYRKLKNDIIKSTNYAEFLNLRNKKR